MSYFNFTFEPYIAIIGDIKKSKKLDNRELFQEKLNNTLAYINEKYNRHLASKFTITLGDEFQGLLTAGDNLIEIITYIKKEIYPVKVRFGIGIGAITTKINPEVSLGADGPCYHKARAAIEALKSKESKNKLAPVDIQIKIAENNEGQELSLNTIFTLLYNLETKWTEKQRAVIYYMLYKKINQNEAADHFNVTQSNIQQILNKGHYYTYKEVLENLNIIFKEVQHDDAI